MNAIWMMVKSALTPGGGSCYAGQCANPAVLVLKAYVAQGQQIILKRHLNGRINVIGKDSIEIPCCINHIPTLNALGMKIASRDGWFIIGRAKGPK